MICAGIQDSGFFFPEPRREFQGLLPVICLIHGILLYFSDELVKVHKMKPTAKWRQSFDNYLSTLPNYYAGVRISTYICFVVVVLFRTRIT